jgi:hypothetical protein
MTMLCRFPPASKSGSITGLAIDYPRPSAAADGLGTVRRIAGSSVGDVWCRRILAVMLAAASLLRVGHVAAKCRSATGKEGKAWGVKSKLQ